MALHRSDALRIPKHTPPPSKALLELQKQGLEFAVSPPPRCLQIGVKEAPTASPASNNDKPLPLEPFEWEKRTSSMYSTDTSITNIIRLYDEHSEARGVPRLPVIHGLEAYEDADAPIDISHLTLDYPCPQQGKVMAITFNTESRSTPVQANMMPTNDQPAPSFTEFSSNIQVRNAGMVSRLAGPLPEIHGIPTYDPLPRSSPAASAVELSVIFAHTPAPPPGKPGTVTDFDEGDEYDEFFPPLDISTLLPSSPTSKAWRKPPPGSKLPIRVESKYQKHITWADKRPADEHVGDVLRQGATIVDRKTSFETGMAPTEKRYQHMGSCADVEHPRVKGDDASQEQSDTIGIRPSFQLATNKRASTWSRINSRRRAISIPDEGSRERYRAVSATLYQADGGEVFSDRLQKKERKAAQKEARRNRPRGKSFDLKAAYENGQHHIVGVIGGMKRKLGREASQTRQRKMAQSLGVARPSGPTSGTGGMDRVTAAGHGPWV